jgi:hypothetical protein
MVNKKIDKNSVSYNTLNGTKLTLKLELSADQTYKEFYVSGIDGQPFETTGNMIVPDTALWFLTEIVTSDVGTLFLELPAIHIAAKMANFGIALSSTANLEGDMVILSSASYITSIDDVDYGCNLSEPEKYFGKFLVVRHGRCAIRLKAFWAQEAGALGLLVLSKEETAISFKQTTALWDINLEDGIDMTSIPCFSFSQSASDQIIKNENSSVVLNGPQDSYLYYQGTKIANLIVKAERNSQNHILKKGYLYPAQSFKCMRKCMGHFCC